ncbi:MAG TPA: glycosyltransferase family 2 protein [Planktothrix sp.]|jgi:1,2-diacylglycerol 3-beta-glucosyltransferase
MRNRLILLSITLSIWMALKAIDEIIDGPEILMFLGLCIAVMISHSSWLMVAQRRWHRRNRRLRKNLVSSGATTTAAPFCALPSQEADLWQPWVDIFIAAKNEERVIERTVRGFFKLNYENFHVWVIDDASTDSTPEVLRNLQREFPRLKTLNRPCGSYPGKSAALNDALALAKGEVIAVFDADASVAPDFFQLTLPLLQPDGIAGVQAQKRIYEQQEGLLVDYQASEYALDTYFQMGRDLIGGAVEFRGNGEVIKRQALIDVGGWNNKSVTDDLDLSMRFLINDWDIRFCPHAPVWEEGVEKLPGLLRQRRRWAEGAIQRYLDYIFPLNSPTRLSFVERLDTLAFTVYFVVPALLILQMSSEVVHFLMRTQSHGKLFALLTFAVYIITAVDFAIAIRIYRRKSVLRSCFDSLGVTAYVYGHWVPVIVTSFCRILLGKQASAWRPTEHGKSVQAMSVEPVKTLTIVR